MSPPLLKPIIEGRADAPFLVFVQGWPDDRTLWDDLVAALADRYRCVRIELPNYDGTITERWGYSHDEMVEALANLVRSLSPGKPVTFVSHDWGAYWTYWLHHVHPELVARIVGLDVAPELKPTLGETVMLVAYQVWLLVAFVLGGRVGDWMTRRMAKLAKTPRQGKALHASMNYPYLYTWRDILKGRASKIFKGYAPDIPVLFVYGEAKPGRFHTDRWLDFLRSRPGNEVVALDGTGHWVTLDPRLTAIVTTWLGREPLTGPETQDALA